MRVPPGRIRGAVTMGRKMYKCFTCGKSYDDEESASRCHDSPVQPVEKDEDRPRPRFLGN
jgi:transposase-like protein